MKPLAYSTTELASKVELDHDSGYKAAGVLGSFDNRPAHLVPLPDGLLEGHGMWLTVTWPDGVVLRQHGRLVNLNTQPEFLVNITEKPKGF